MESGSGIGGQSGLSARFGVAKIWAVTTTECFSYPVPATPCCLDWMTRGRLRDRVPGSADGIHIDRASFEGARAETVFVLKEEGAQIATWAPDSANGAQRDCTSRRRTSHLFSRTAPPKGVQAETIYLVKVQGYTDGPPSSRGAIWTEITPHNEGTQTAALLAPEYKTYGRSPPLFSASGRLVAGSSLRDRERHIGASPRRTVKHRMADIWEPSSTPEADTWDLSPTRQSHGRHLGAFSTPEADTRELFSRQAVAWQTFGSILHVGGRRAGTLPPGRRVVGIWECLLHQRRAHGSSPTLSSHMVDIWELSSTPEADTRELFSHQAVTWQIYGSILHVGGRRAGTLSR
ncbi:hypothetical protein FIBSPDRAFT_884053 [Athelia psychrophila]|uniref:Uncharacterized protein n=1 Tax=Athelia psychrophila TaxID=1759441 RepID=A0A166TDK4_9AGAM|nr:hypothetical protein FIBSPDRAFT_884053 [Fibularhizoctonia sp. CBS 109695]